MHAVHIEYIFNVEEAFYSCSFNHKGGAAYLSLFSPVMLN